MWNKELFDQRFEKRADGTRKNRILLAFLTNPDVRQYLRANKQSRFVQHLRYTNKLYVKHFACNEENLCELPTSMAELDMAVSRVMDAAACYYAAYLGSTCMVGCRKYDVLDNGLCFDNDATCIRVKVRETGKICKIKFGKFFKQCIEDNPFGRILPESVKTWITERRCVEFTAWASENLHADLELHVSSERADFKRIYGSTKECDDSLNHSSCMRGGDHADFYADSVSAKAAWLTDENDVIVCRCIVFTDVTDADGVKYRLAERQYAKNEDNVLKQILVNRLIAAGEIDGYKAIGADCHANRNFVANNGDSLRDKVFHIHCDLNDDDILSYQDSFVYYDLKNHTAYNDDVISGMHFQLDDTSLYFSATPEGCEWDEYNEMWTNEYYEGWYDHHEIYIDVNHAGDFYEIDGTYYHEDDVEQCPRCDEHFLAENGFYSELTDEWYCCSSCRDEAEEDWRREHMFYARWDDEWVEDADEISEIIAIDVSRPSGFVSIEPYTILTSTLSDLIADGGAILVDGVAIEMTEFYTEEFYSLIRESQYLHFTADVITEQTGYRYSPITAHWYKSEEAKISAEMAFKRAHWYYCEYDNIYVERADAVCPIVFPVRKDNNLWEVSQLRTISRNYMNSFFQYVDFVWVGDGWRYLAFSNLEDRDTFRELTTAQQLEIATSDNGVCKIDNNSATA